MNLSYKKGSLFHAWCIKLQFAKGRYRASKLQHSLFTISCSQLCICILPSVLLTRLPFTLSLSPPGCLPTGSGMLRLNLRCKHRAGQSMTGPSATHTPLRPMHQACWWAPSSLGFCLNSNMDILLLLFNSHVEFQNFKRLMVDFRRIRAVGGDILQVLRVCSCGFEFRVLIVKEGKSEKH